METYYEKIKSRSMNNSITSEIVNISKNYHEMKIMDEKTEEAKTTYELASQGYISEFAKKVKKEELVQEQENKAQSNTEYVTLDVQTPIEENVVEEVPVVDVPVVEETLPPEEPTTISETPVEEKKTISDINEPTKELRTTNEDVIGKAKEIINMDIPSGSVVLDEYLKHHDPDTNEALVGTLLYIDPVAISNNITNEAEYLQARGINASDVMRMGQQEETQGKGR